MSGAHEGCSQGKSVRDREGSKHSTAATLERVDSEAAVLPQDFEDTVHARQLKALCRRVGRRMSRQGPGRSPSIGLTHLNAARSREKVEWGPALHESKSLSDLVSRWRASCNTSTWPSQRKPETLWSVTHAHLHAAQWPPRPMPRAPRPKIHVGDVSGVDCVKEGPGDPH